MRCFETCSQALSCSQRYCMRILIHHNNTRGSCQVTWVYMLCTPRARPPHFSLYISGPVALFFKPCLDLLLYIFELFLGPRLSDLSCVYCMKNIAEALPYNPMEEFVWKLVVLAMFQAWWPHPSAQHCRVWVSWRPAYSTQLGLYSKNLSVNRQTNIPSELRGLLR